MAGKKTGKDWRRSMKLRLPVCPHCGQKVGYAKAWFLKQEGEYRCPNCGGFSNVHLASSGPMVGSVAVIASILVFVALRLLTGGMPFYGVLLMALPYALFFLTAPFLVRLRKPGTRRRPPQQGPGNPKTPPPHAPAPPPGRDTGGNSSIRRL